MSDKHFSADDCLQLVMKSPAAVSVHDKAAWLSIFAAYNIVEDPVGSAPHLSGVYDRIQGHRSFGPLGRFYDTFIASNEIMFHVDRDIVCGQHVVRDLSIEIKMSPAVTVIVPMHLLYELREEEGELKVFRLAAHWELAPMLKQQMAFGWASVVAGTVAAGRMLRYLGLRGTAKFMTAVSSVGNRGKERVASFANAWNRSNEGELNYLFARPIDGIGFPYGGERFDIAALAALPGELSFSKTLAAGNFVTASFQYQEGEVCHQGVAFFEFNRRSLKIESLNFYYS